MIETSQPDLAQASLALEFLLGSWTLDRTVSGLAHAAGTARVERTSAVTADWSEEVTVVLASGVTLRATQAWSLVAVPSGLELRYGRLSRQADELFQQLGFHPQAPGVWTSRAHHHCGADRYDSAYCLKTPNEFSITHVVRGPAKQYTSTTRYLRRSALT